MTETDDNNQQTGTPPAPGFGGLAQSIGTRTLWIIILTMPAVFLVVVAAIIAVFGKPKREAPDIAEPVVVEETAAASGAPAPISLKAGESAGAIALDGDRLAVRVDGPDGVVVVIYDIARKEEIARIPIAQD